MRDLYYCGIAKPLKPVAGEVYFDPVDQRCAMFDGEKWRIIVATHNPITEVSHRSCGYCGSTGLSTINCPNCGAPTKF